MSLATDNVPVSLWPCIWQAVERVDRATGEVVAPGQRIGREEALKCASTQGAWLCMEEQDRGTLEAGKLADFIVLPENPLAVPAPRLATLAPDLTVVGGKTVWERNPRMSILDTDKTLPANKMIFEVRRDAALRERFRSDLEGLMRDYGLSEKEKTAFRSVDLKRLGELGVHPYFLPQVSRLFKGAGYNHNESDAAQLYAEKMLKERS